MGYVHMREKTLHGNFKLPIKPAHFIIQVDLLNIYFGIDILPIAYKSDSMQSMN